MKSKIPLNEVIRTKITKNLKQLGVKNPTVNLERPAEMDFGDLSTNAAIAYSKELGLKPMEIATAIVKAFNDEPLSQVAKVEIAGFGFINFYFSEDYLTQTLVAAAFNSDFSQNQSLKDERIIIDYTDPNPFKEFHIGHLMTNAIGEVASRLFEVSGAEVRRACYQGDVGLHIAKTIYGLEHLTGQYYWYRYFASNELGAKFLGRAYAEGAKAYEGSDEAKTSVIKINSLIYSRADKKVNRYYDWGRKVSLKYFDQIYKLLDTQFDHFFFESEMGPIGLEIVEREKKIFKESEGAIIFAGQEYGLNTRVFINSHGLPTYEAKELGLFEKKREVYDFTKTYSVTATEQDNFFKVLTTVIELIHPKMVGSFHHLTHGLLKLPTGKMSSRTGDVIAATDLINTVTNEMREQFKSKHLDSSTIKQVAIGAIKFAILRQAPGKDVVFDFSKSLSLEGDSGPYLAYTHARARSVITKASKAGFNLTENITYKTQESTVVSRLVERFPEVVEQAARELAPQALAVYLLNLASAFNRFYNEQKIIDSDNPNNAYANLLLTKAVAETIKTGLRLLSITAPNKM